MAARRFAKSSVDWAAFSQKVPPSQKNEYLAFKSKADGFLRAVTSLPEEPPKIDWGFYKSKVNVPGLVDSFQKQYEAFKIPYPQDTYSSVYDKDEKVAYEAVNKFIAEANETIKKAEEEIINWDSIPPIETMTLQEFAEYFPDKAFDPINRPTFWPHTPDYQPTEEDEEKWRRKLAGEEDH